MQDRSYVVFTVLNNKVQPNCMTISQVEHAKHAMAEWCGTELVEDTTKTQFLQSFGACYTEIDNGFHLALMLPDHHARVVFAFTKVVLMGRLQFAACLETMYDADFENLKIRDSLVSDQAENGIYWHRSYNGGDLISFNTHDLPGIEKHIV